MARVVIVTSKANGFLGLIYTVRIDLTYSDFSDPNDTKTITLYDLPFCAQYIDCWADIKQGFIGGNIETYTISAGRGENFEDKILAANNVKVKGLLTSAEHKGLDLTTPGQTNMYSTEEATTLTVTATCTGDTLGSATEGKISIYLLISQAPSSDE